jgi:ribose-phosphate pyrophosphokinase
MSRSTARLLLAFAEEEHLAGPLARALDCPLAYVHRHAFPDGETRITLPEHLPAEVVLLRGLHEPNAKLAELAIAAPAAREGGARSLTLVAPYLAYMRQDMAFHPGEAVSQRHIGALIAHLFDRLVTLDPHLHRVRTLDEVVPGKRGLALSAAVPLGEWIAAHEPEAVLIGPDEEAAQWVEAAARAHGLRHGVGRKVRRGDRDVSVELPALPLQGRAVVLMDDVASTGRTLIEAARHALQAGAASVDVAVTHALFRDDAVEQLRAAGVRHVWSTDSVRHGSNVVSVAPLIAAGLLAAFSGGGASSA